MSPVKNSTVKEIDVKFEDKIELDNTIKKLKADSYVNLTTSLKKFQQEPREYDYWYSKAKMEMKICNKNNKIFDLTDKLLKTYDKIV